MRDPFASFKRPTNPKRGTPGRRAPRGSTTPKSLGCTAQFVRQEGLPVRFLFTSGYAAHEILRGDLAEGELQLLQKPWTLADLTHRVRDVLDVARKEGP